MKYSEIIGVSKYFKSAFDIMSDNGTAWKAFISNEKFESNLSQIINSFTSPVFNNRKSIWIQGTYGTGKSHSLAVIKHLLCDEYTSIEDYIPRINRGQLKSQLSAFRKDKRVFPVVMKGVYTITDVADLAYTIQQEVAAALNKEGIKINTKTDFESVLQILEKGSLDTFFQNLIDNNIELHSYAANKQQLVASLENKETKVIRILADELKKAGLGGFRTHNIIEWLREIKEELQERGIADYLLIIWDELTSLLEIQERRSILNVLQDIAELSYSEVDDGTDTEGVYLLLVTHKKLEATASYKELKEDEKRMAKARFVELDYGMQPTTTFHILAGALECKMPQLWDELKQKNYLNVPSVMTLVDKVVNSDATNASEIKEKIINLYPFHPYTSYLETFVSRAIGEAERSVFGFLNDDTTGFKKYLENEIEDTKFLTADYVWDFFYKDFESNVAGNFDAITNKFKLFNEIVEVMGAEYLAIFKVILLLNVLYRVTTTDADDSEKSMVKPSAENIIAAFSGVMEAGAVVTVLDYIDDAQIMHRNPDGVFEVATSSLPQKRLLEEKKRIQTTKEDPSKIIEEYAISCRKKLNDSISRNVVRKVDTQVFWGGDKEHLLRGKVAAKFKKAYTLNVALIVYRGDTPELDAILGRTEASLSSSKDMIVKLSKEDDFKNIVFVIANTALGNRRFEAYLDSLAQEAVARSLQMDEERNEGQRNAEKWISQWILEIIGSGMADMVFRGDSIYVPFGQCHKKVKDNYVETIFKYGFDGLGVASTFWKHQVSKKAVELVLYSATKSELEKNATSNDTAVKSLLTSGNVVLFNEQLELISDDSSIPMVKVCKEVDKIFESKKNETSINLAREFEFLVRPEYGYYQNRLFMGALAFALRPYLDRLYTAGNGQRIDKVVMKTVVVSIFECWEKNTMNDKFIVRMSTDEERELTDRLNLIFDITDQDGLLGTKWAIRKQFQSQSKAPLWALKYASSNSDEFNKFIDKMFKFSKSTDDNIQQRFIEELLAGVKTFDLELNSVISKVKNTQCLDSFILKELEKIGAGLADLPEVRKYLDGKLSGEIVFWEETDVYEQILLWKIDSTTSAPNPDESFEDNQGENSATDGQDNGGKNDVNVDDLRSEVKNKIEANKADSKKLYQVLIKLADKYSDILKDIHDFL